MSINTVLITPAEEKYSPPESIIELAVVYDGPTDVVREKKDDGESQWFEFKYPRQIVLLSHSTYEETEKGSTITRKTEFPAIDVNDLIRALGSFGIAVQSIHAGPPPTRMPAPEVPA